MKIDWKKLWAEFHDWYRSERSYFPTWEQNRRKIQRLVEAELKPKRKR